MTDHKEMGFFDHLDELRGRLVKSLILWVLVFCACFYFHKQIFAFLAEPYLSLDTKNGWLMVDPKEPFMAHIRACLWTSFILSSVIFFYHFWAFVAPGLTKSEKRFARPFVTFLAILFVLGCAFSFLQVFPSALDFLLKYDYDSQAKLIERSKYLGLLFAFVLGMGLCFELPMVLFFLAKIGLTSPKFLLEKFKYAVLIIFIVAAVLTPTPEPTIQIIFAAPLLVLYLLGVGAAWLVYREKDQVTDEEDIAAMHEVGAPMDGEDR